MSTDIVIAQPVERVSAYAADPDNAPAWYENIKSVEWKTPAVSETNGVYLRAEYDPGRRLMMRTAEGPFPMETTYTWEAVSGGTRMTLRNRGVPTGFSRLAAPLMEIAMRRANRKDLAALKRLMEA